MRYVFFVFRLRKLQNEIDFPLHLYSLAFLLSLILCQNIFLPDLENHNLTDIELVDASVAAVLLLVLVNRLEDLIGTPLLVLRHVYNL